MKRRVVIVVLVLVGGFLYWYTHRSTLRPGELEGSGTIEATQVDLAPKVSGRVTVLNVKEGDVVHTGQVVAELDAVELQEQLDEARASLQEARDKVKSGQDVLALERDQYEALLRQARATAGSSEARVPQAGENLRLQEGTVAAQIKQVQAQVSSAQASLAAAQGNARAAAESYRAAQGNLKTQTANLEKARDDRDRYELLFKQDAISAQQVDLARTTLQGAIGQRDSARAQVAAARAQRDAAQGQEQAAASAVTQSQEALNLAQVNLRTIPIRRLDVDTARAQLEQAQSGIQVAEAAHARIAQRESELASDRSSEKQAEAALRLAQTNPDNAVLKAPFDGTILSKNVEVGDLVSPGSAMVTIADMKRPYLRVYVSETVQARVKLGQKAEIKVDALPDRTFSGVVDEIRTRAEYIPGNVQTKDERAKLVFGVRIALDNPDGFLKPGLPADAVIFAPMTLAIDCQGLSKRFGARKAVDNLSLQVLEGEILACVGPDGSGKSTMIRMLCGAMTPDSGRATVLGFDVIASPEEVKARIGYMPQRFSLYSDLTVMENLRLYGDIYLVDDMEATGMRLLEEFRLAPFTDRLASQLSGGMKQKLALACTLIHRPQLLFLDEPTTGVDPVSRRQFWRILYGLNRDGLTILVSTPYMDEAERASRVALFAAGEIMDVNTPAELKKTLLGDLLEISATPADVAARVLPTHPAAISAEVFGNVVHVLVASAAESEPALRRALTEGGATQVEIRRGQASLEDIFISRLAAFRPGAEVG